MQVRPERSAFLDPDGGVSVCPPGTFVGRGEFLDRTLQALRKPSGAAVLLLHGPAGVGKSTAAARLCEGLTGHRRVVVVGGLDERSLLLALARGAQDAAKLPAIANARGALSERLASIFAGPLADPPAVFVFDAFDENLVAREEARDQPSPASSEILHALVAAIRDSESASLVIVTCRQPFSLAGLGIEPMAIAPLDDAEVAEFSGQLTRAQAEIDPETRTKALALAAGVPRLIEWLDLLLADPRTDAQQLCRALEGSATDRREAELVAALVSQLREPEVTLLRQLSLLDLPVDIETVSALSGTGDRASTLQPLVDRGLVEEQESASGESRLYRSARHVGQLIDPLAVDESQAVASRALADLHQRRWLDAEQADDALMVELHRLSLVAGDRRRGTDLTATISDTWFRQARFREARALCEEALFLGDDHRVLHQLARAEDALGESGDASSHYERALSICPPDDLHERAAILQDFAALRDVLGEIGPARAMYQESIALHERTANRAAQAHALHQLAGWHTRQGDLGVARTHYKEALAIREGLGDQRGRADTLHQLAGLAAREEEPSDALALYQQALAVREQIGDLRGRASTLQQLADFRARQGSADLARALLQQALALREQIGDSLGRAAVLQQLAGVLEGIDDHEAAIGRYGELADLRAQIGDQPGRAAALHQVAGLHAQQGRLDLATTHYEQVLAIEEQLVDTSGKAATLANLAGLAHRSGDKEGARTLWREAATLLSQSGNFRDLFGVADNLGSLGDRDGMVQAAWLAARLPVPARDAVRALARLQEVLGDDHAAAPLLATTALLVCDLRGSADAQLEDLRRFAVGMLTAAAQARGIDDRRFPRWFQAEQLNDPPTFLLALNQALVALIEEAAWLFDRQVVEGATR